MSYVDGLHLLLLLGFLALALVRWRIGLIGLARLGGVAVILGAGLHLGIAVAIERVGRFIGVILNWRWGLLLLRLLATNQN